MENDTPRPSPLDIQISLRTLEGRDAICDTSATESLRQRRGNKKRTSFFLVGCPAESPIQCETLETAIVGCLPFGQHIHHQFFWYFRERPQKSPENCCCSIWRSCFFFFRPEVVVMDLILCHWVDLLKLLRVGCELERKNPTWEAGSDNLNLFELKG